ncbi:STAS domain-containing protein [Bacillus sp. C1-1]|nr:STAS domain-containing protein [Bacillus sp. C1-1]
MPTDGLYSYIKSKTNDLTEEWYKSLDKSQDGVYSTSDPQQIELLKDQNRAFHALFTELFNPSKAGIHDDEFLEWIESIANDRAHQRTPFNNILSEFFRTQQQYMNLILSYAESMKQEYVSLKDVYRWNEIVVQGINEVILEFSRQNKKQSDYQLNAQKQMIDELSSPIIQLAPKTALLPLVGEIDTHRAKIMFDHTLQHCSEQYIHTLFIDLSGVPIIDTMVAQQIFQLIKGLKLIGVQTSLSGLRPEIAQTAVQLGISFSDVTIHSTLAQALERKQLIF